MNIWKRKLLAYLHDPPSKAVSIADHEDHAKTLYRQAGFSDEEAQRFGQLFAKPSDWTASAADRLPFPGSQASGLRCAFDGVRNAFLHPLGPGTGSNEPLRLPFSGPFLSSDAARETDQVIQPVIAADQLEGIDEDKAWRARFFAHWRLWQRNAVERDYRFALLPADTRLPDHTVWTHMQVVSALDSCAVGAGKDAILRPAFLRFQLGPVQEFIAAARSTRDLWSGSYLLSWLMAAGLKALTAEIGPDSVIFPSLRNQPLFDLHWKKDLWDWIRCGDRTAWQSLGYQAGDRSLLTPNLPNVFLAVVPAERAGGLGELVEKAIQDEWNRIADAVWNECDSAVVSENETLVADEGAHFTRAMREQRFRSQTAKFLSLSWQATPWPDSLSEAIALASGFGESMPIAEAARRVETIVQLAQEAMSVEHRDRRYYTDDSKNRLNNIGLGWSVILAMNAWQLDSVRQTRAFGAWSAGGWQTGSFNNKDSLTGREEAVAGGRVWQERCSKLGQPWAALFKKDDWLGASTLVKRLWHIAYLNRDPWNLPTDRRSFPMPNTRGIASHEPETDCGDDETGEKDSPSEKYFAVLAFDGDEIGKWISGEKTPRFATQLADYTDAGGAQRQGSKAYYANPDNKQQDLLEARRPLSPSYHIQFSEALSNFALFCARPIVEVFDGRLIYAGGDDVVALLPADTALACARALRAAFQGDPSLESRLRDAVSRLPVGRQHFFQQMAQNGSLLKCPAPGFLVSGDLPADHNAQPVPFIVPGPAADCSIGIAIAHHRAPLQDVVRAALLAEKRAKNPKKSNRSAVAVTLFKRSGETNEWDFKWESGGLDLYHALAGALEKGQLSSKFPYRTVELLEPYLDRATGLDRSASAGAFDSVADPVIEREFLFACDRQRGPHWAPEIVEDLLPSLKRYISQLSTAEAKVRALIGLCRTVAFAHRTRTESIEPTDLP